MRSLDMVETTSHTSLKFATFVVSVPVLYSKPLAPSLSQHQSPRPCRVHRRSICAHHLFEHLADVRHLIPKLGAVPRHLLKAQNMHKHLSKVGESSSSALSNLGSGFEEAKETVQQLAPSAKILGAALDTYILGDDVNIDDLPPSTIVRDLTVPLAPGFFGLVPMQAIDRLCGVLTVCDVSQERRDKLRGQLEGLARAVRARADAYQVRALALALPSSRDGDENGNGDKEATGRGLDALTWLLREARFVVLPQLPTVGEPAHAGAVPLGLALDTHLDATLFQESETLRHLVETCDVPLGGPSHYPYLYVATRGTCLSRRSGLLVKAKLRALERSFYSLIRVPIASIVSVVKTLFKWNRAKEVASDIDEGEDITDTDISTDRKNLDDFGNSTEDKHTHEDNLWALQRIRRVVPSVELNAGWSQLFKQLSPSITQEPCHDHFFCLYRPIEVDEGRLRDEKRTALQQQARDSFLTALNPLPPEKQTTKRVSPTDDGTPTQTNSQRKSLNEFKRSPGTLQRIVMTMFSNVPWGTVLHFFPTTYVLPATRDLLRVDMITFVGLVSAAFSFARQSNRSSALMYLLFSLASYTFRVAVGWKNSLNMYSKTLATEKADSLLCQGRSCIDYVTTLAVEEMFADVSCVWLANVYPVDDMDARKLQQRAFGKPRLDDEVVREWSEWLDKHEDYIR